MSNVRVNKAALAALASHPDVEAALQRVGDQVAQRAAEAAPKRTGAGARSIRAELARSSSRGGSAVNVSWDQEHFYMIFSEVGTSRMSARPFLRPALDAHYTL